MSRRARVHGDDGSILLSFLAMMIVSGLLLVVAATVLNGQQQTRFDRNFEDALQIAEVGQSQMVSLIQSQPESPAFAPMTGSTNGGGAYEVSAVKDAQRWTVTSLGTAPDGRQRTTQIQVRVRPLFGLAAFGRTALIMNGGNGADSFDSSQGTDICRTYTPTDYIDPGYPTRADTAGTDHKVCRRTNVGAVATNGRLFLKGVVADVVDKFEIHNAKRLDNGQAPYGVIDPIPGATGVCEGVNETCNQFRLNGKGSYHREPIELPPINQCDDPDSAAVSYDGDAPTPDQQRLRGERYFFTDATLTGKSFFTGTTSQPTILCVSGKLTLKSKNLINFKCSNEAEPRTGSTVYAPTGNCPSGGRWIPRKPGSLLIFLTGEGGSRIEMGDNASVSAAVFAPNAAVECGPQGNFYGSLVANSIENSGGWNFHYDDALAALMANAPIRVENWRELD